MRRFDGNLIHYDWQVDRVVAAIRSAAQDPEKPAIADSRGRDRETAGQGAGSSA